MEYQRFIIEYKPVYHLLNIYTLTIVIKLYRCGFTLEDRLGIQFQYHIEIGKGFRRFPEIYDPVATTLLLFSKISKKYNYVLYLKTIPEKPSKGETCRLKSDRVLCFPDQLFGYTCKCTVFVEF